MRRFLVIPLMVVLVAGLIFGGCAKPAPEKPEVKTLKIGALTDFGFPLGADFKKELEAIVPAFNEKGGLLINGERYNIDLIIYDTKMDPEIGRAAVERLVYQDKVKFILGDETADAWLPVTEENKVLVIATSPSPAILSPDLKYVFQSSFLHTDPPTLWGWFSENYPDLKTVAALFTDDMKGHAEAGHLERLCEVFGQELLTIEFYPPDCTDFSAFATKIKRKNPDVFTTCAGGTLAEALTFKSLYEVGYKGQIFFYMRMSVPKTAKVIPLDMVEGMICGLAATDLDSLSPVAKELRDVYTAEYGEWISPVVLHVNTWYCLMAALEQAQSLDPDKVAGVIGNGMRFESAAGPAMMISRPDLGNPKTVDTLYEAYVGRIENAEAKLIYTIPVEEGLKYCKAEYGW